MSQFIISISQIFLFAIFRVFGVAFIKSSSRTGLPIDHTAHKYIFVANHVAGVDPFIITTRLSFAQFVKLSPYRFFTKNVFYDNMLLRPFLILFGCFPAQNHKHGYGITKAVELLDLGHTVFIFPEGKVSKMDRQHLPRKGVEVLVRSTNALLIPARVKWNRRKGIWRSYSVSIGKPFNGKNMTAEQIMDVVYSLKFS